jgi:hypothetical protein
MQATAFPVYHVSEGTVQYSSCPQNMQATAFPVYYVSEGTD